MSLVVSVIAVLLAYPVAYLLALIAGARKYTLLLVIIVPFLTSYLLRVLAWRVILSSQGVVNSFLQTAGLADEPIDGSSTASSRSASCSSYVWVPFVALPIFVSLEGLDHHLLEAWTDLGASRLRDLLDGHVPAVDPGVVAGFIFVFIPTIGEYVTPQLVGGPSGFMFGSAIQSAFTAASTGSSARRWRCSWSSPSRCCSRSSAASSTSGASRMNIAVSTAGVAALGDFWLLVVFLYAPIVILVIFSFNDREIVSFPWEGFTIRWYRTVLEPAAPRRAAQSLWVARLPASSRRCSRSRRRSRWCGGGSRARAWSRG